MKLFLFPTPSRRRVFSTVGADTEVLKKFFSRHRSGGGSFRRSFASIAWQALSDKHLREPGCGSFFCIERKVGEPDPHKGGHSILPREGHRRCSDPPCEGQAPFYIVCLYGNELRNI